MKTKKILEYLKAVYLSLLITTACVAIIIGIKSIILFILPPELQTISGAESVLGLASGVTTASLLYFMPDNGEEDEETQDN
ncbi:MAG: hypothetical protein WCT42_01340 [Candidatus Paceibacterota bacterium]|jgi:hypothetical protein